jgi:hypothetical protein
MKNLLPLLLVPAFLSACDGKGDDTGSPPGEETEDLGSFTTDTGGLTPDVAFNVPEGTNSAVVYCGPYGDTLLGTAWEIKDGTGAYLYTNSLHESYAPSKMRVGNLDDLVPVLMPVSPDGDISSGAHTMKVWIAAGGTPTDVACKALYRTDAVANSGTIDLHFVFVGVDLTADTAAKDADFTAALDKVREWWGLGGLEIGDITYEDFTGDTTKYAVVDVDTDDPGEFNDLIRTSAPGKVQVLTLFMVQEISSSDGATILGQAAGPPGLPNVHGTSKSGMVVTTADLHDDPTTVGLIIAHEGAHFLGLFHTSEKNGETHDPIADTPECTAADDANGNGVVEPSECAGKGAENLLFWGAGTGTSDVSDDQSWVLRRNPAVQ